MFKTLQSTFTQDADLPARSFRLQMLGRVLDGTIYDNLKYSFHEEKAPNEEYVPIRDRRPSVRYRLCRLVVDDAVSLLFSEGHFPEFECSDETTKENIQKLVKELYLNESFIDAATKGSVGSVAILLRILESRAFVSVLQTTYLTPIWKPLAPDELLRVEERYKVKGKDLRASGYTVKDIELEETFWFARDWTELEETWYLPLSQSDYKEGKPLKRDDTKSVKHDLGFVPIVWIKNLPNGDDIDGDSTLPDESIDTSIEIDYQLSQAGRGLKYSSDPTLLIKEPAMGDSGSMVKGAGNAIVVSADGDAKMLEINGTAVEAVINYVRLLREIALESMHGNRANTEKQSAAPSGRALEMMNQSLIWLADKLRISYGEKGLLNLINMIVKAHAKVPLVFKNGDKLAPISKTIEFTLRWPTWYAPTMLDMYNRAQALQILVESGILSRETAIKVISAEYDIEDAQAEKVLADADLKMQAELNKPATHTKQTIFQDANKMMVGATEQS